MSKPKPKLNGLKRVSLQQTSVFVFSGIAAILLMALVTHSNTDCAFFTQDNDCTNHNKAGVYGAWIADILFAFFGYLAYLIPIALVIIGIVAFRFPTKAKPDISEGGVNTVLTAVGFVLTLFAGSGLATMLWPDVDLYYRGGGLFGVVVVKVIRTEFGDYGSALLLLSLFFAGITLLGDIKWGTVADAVGKYLLRFFDYILSLGDTSDVAPTGEADKGNAGQNPLVAKTGKLAGVVVGAAAAVTTSKALSPVAHKVKSFWATLKYKVRSLLPSSEPLVSMYHDSPDPLTESVLNVARDADLSRERVHNPVMRDTTPYPEEPSSESSYSVNPQASLPQAPAPSQSAAPQQAAESQPSGLSVPPSQVLHAPSQSEFAESAADISRSDVLTPIAATPIANTAPPAQPVAPAQAPPPQAAPPQAAPTSPQAPQAAPPQASAPVQDASAPARGGQTYDSTPKPLYVKERPTSGKLPTLDLLDSPPQDQHHYSTEYLENMADNLVEALGHYNIKESVVENYYPGPVITRYEIQLKPGTKVSRVSSIVKDLARTLGVPSVRLVDVIPGTTNIGIEVPNDTRNLVTIQSVIGSPEFQNTKSPLTMVLGSDIAGDPVAVDLGKMPHCLVAGTTGSGKSVGVNAMLLSILFKARPDEVKMILIDPKMLELSIYEDIPHLLTPVVTDMKDAANSLRWCVAEMERRYLLMSKLKVRNVAGFNEKVKRANSRGEPIIDPLYDITKSLDVEPKALEPLPLIVVVIDEFADMMMVVGKKVEELIARLAQKARAAGIHLVLATQRPSVDVITGLIKANIPTRIAFQVTSSTDSRTILDQMGAEQLLGKGDMLYLPPGQSVPQRVHGAFVSDGEVDRVVTHVKENQGEPDYIEGVLQEPESGDAAIPGLEPISIESEKDALYDEAVAVITESRRASISYLQRRLKVGYNRAAGMIEDMEAAGVVSSVQSNGMREVLAPPPVLD